MGSARTQCKHKSIINHPKHVVDNTLQVFLVNQMKCIDSQKKWSGLRILAQKDPNSRDNPSQSYDKLSKNYKIKMISKHPTCHFSSNFILQASSKTLLYTFK